MLPERHRQYLETIGIDLWVSRARGRPSVATAAPSSAAPTEAPAPARPEPPGGEPSGPAVVPSGEAATQWQQLLEEVRRCTPRAPRAFSGWGPGAPTGW